MANHLPLNGQHVGALQEACVALGGHPLQKLLLRHEDGAGVPFTEGDRRIVDDYIARIEAHIESLHPRHDSNEPDFDPADEDAYLDLLADWRHDLVYAVSRWEEDQP